MNSQLPYLVEAQSDDAARFIRISVAAFGMICKRCVFLRSHLLRPAQCDAVRSAHMAD